MDVDRVRADIRDGEQVGKIVQHLGSMRGAIRLHGFQRRGLCKRNRGSEQQSNQKKQALHGQHGLAVVVGSVSGKLSALSRQLMEKKLIADS